MDSQITKIGTEEGERCNRDGCEGTMGYTPGGDGDCSCHITPPCWNCTNSVFECAECGATPDEAAGK